MEIDTNNLHHAYLIESAPQSGERFLHILFEKINFNTVGNADYYEWKGDSFSIADARLLREKALGRAFGKKKIFVIAAPRLNPEAQNALLKTFEDPIKDTHFFILLPHRDLLLPTLLSRLQIVRVEADQLEGKEAENFLNLIPRERLEFVKKFVDKELPLSSFLDSLLEYMREKKMDQSETKKVFILREFANDPAVSTRLILEHLALVLK